MFLTLLTLIAIKLVECFLHPTKTAIGTATYAQRFLVFCIKDAPAIMRTTSTHAQNLLLPSVQDDPAITMTNHANSKLQLIVEYLLLPRNFERPAITMTVNTRNLLPFFVQNDPAITIASSLQLIVESLFLLRNEDNSETMAPSLLLFCIKDAPAIMTAPLANFSLQLIVDIFCKISFHFCEDYRIFCEGEY
jgi:hypothetical protein